MSYRRFLRRLREYVGTAPARLRPRFIHPSSFILHPFRVRPLVEPLEDRTLPSVSATLASPVTASAGSVVNISKRIGNQQESTIAVNPTDPAQLCVVSNVESSTPGVFTAYSGDAGATWTGRILGSGTGMGGDGLPDACCDPQSAWDSFGNLFVTYLDVDDNAVQLLLSTDGGKTFALAKTFTDAGGTPDQPSIAVGAGSVWLSWTDSGGNIEAVGARVTGQGAVGAFPAPQVLPDSANGDFGGIAVGPTGQVLVTYQYGLTSGAGPDTIVVNQDLTGLGGTFGNAITVTTTQVGGTDTNIPAMSNNFGIDAEANLAWDRSGGPHNGRAYLVYTDAPSPSSSATTTYLRYSDDNGATWSARVKVNDDKTIFSKFLPSVSVDQTTGAVGVAWYDCRNDPGSGPGDTDGKPNTDAEMYAAVSGDGGQTFAPNVRLSPAPSNSADSEPPDFNGDRPLGYGDFQTSDFADGAFYRVWADNSDFTGDNPNGFLKKLDLYTARLAVAENVTVAADPGTNTITVRLDPTGANLQVFQNVPTTGAPTFTAALPAVRSLTFQGGGGNDQLIVDTSNGDPLPAGGIGFTGGGGADTLTLQGGGAVTDEVYTGGGPG
ncbi:MAG TPA: sialidase family protein, partial [Gemmataceae bacterium]|nr:sialidase family protein [Gemmataceae bacterium]